MQVCYRLNLHKLFPELLKCVHKVLTDTMTAQFNDEQHGSVSQGRFWRTYGKYMVMWNPNVKEQIDRLQAVQGKWYGNHV